MRFLFVTFDFSNPVVDKESALERRRMHDIGTRLIFPGQRAGRHQHRQTGREKSDALKVTHLHVLHPVRFFGFHAL